MKRFLWLFAELSVLRSKQTSSSLFRNIISFLYPSTAVRSSVSIIEDGNVHITPLSRRNLQNRKEKVSGLIVILLFRFRRFCDVQLSMRTMGIAQP